VRTGETYVFSDAAGDAELQRLRALEAAFDADTRRTVEAIGISPGWRCVEVGAGAGSVATWLALSVGENGHVTAVDIDGRFLSGLARPNLDVVEADICAADIPPGAADLVHARFVLIHQPNPDGLFAAMVRLLRPGGWLVLEEPDFSVARSIQGDVEHRVAFDRVNRAIERMFSLRGMNHAYGTRVAELLQVGGLEQISVSASAPADRGGGPVARMMAMSTQALAAKYLATGLATPADIAGYAALASDPASFAVYHGVVRGIGRKPRP
jgi:SAM-dependent methyltransferase